MSKFGRSFLFLIVAIQLAAAAALFGQWGIITNMWPYEGTTPLTFILISSIFAAAGAATFWAVASRNDGALAGIGLDFITILTPLSFLQFRLAAARSDPRLIVVGILFASGALLGLVLLLWSLPKPIDRTVPAPRLVRWSFALYVAALFFVSTRLLLKVPNVIPWAITPDLSVLIGWMFFGAAFYFLYGFLRPSWANAAGQSISFLVYDLVLIVPFLRKLPTTPPEFRTGLIVYLIVIVYSGLVASYFLFVHGPTRLRFGRPGGAG